MTIRAGASAALYGAFYEDGERITNLSSYSIQCRLLTIEGKEIKNKDSKIKIASDGSICVILDAEDTTNLKGRVLFTFRLKQGGETISEITKDFDVV